MKKLVTLEEITSKIESYVMLNRNKIPVDNTMPLIEIIDMLRSIVLFRDGIFKIATPFVESLLKNDLKGAYRYADEPNKKLIGFYLFCLTSI